MDSVPTFEGTRSRHGRLDVACSTLASYEWLHNVVNQITIFGDTRREQHFSTFPLEANQSLLELRFFLSGPPVSRDRFLRIFSGQNRNLRTDRWVLKHQAKTPKGQLLVWGIDSDSVAALEAVDMHPHFGLGRVTFRVSRDQPKTEDL